MSWKASTLFVAVVCVLIPNAARAQTWTSTDVGDVGLGGNATDSNGTWTVQGAGADIWGTADSFQFVHQTTSSSGYIQARVTDLQNTNGFAKAGVMIRASTAPDAATAILDIRPDGEIEFMDRPGTGSSMMFLAGGAYGFPAWLRLSWTGGSISAWVSHDNGTWSSVGSGSIALSLPAEAGLAVTSHDPSQLTTAHFDNVTLANQAVPGWNSIDVGAVGAAGSAAEVDGAWTVSGAGGDIWGTADAFHYLYRPAMNGGSHLVVRVDDLQNTNLFAKAGIMVRASLDPGAATVILDVRPDGDVEFMARSSQGGEMSYLGGTSVTLPAWLQLDWTADANNAPATFTASVSQDKQTWTTVGQTSGLPLSPAPATYDVGVAVTSHDTAHLNTAHVHGLSLLASHWWADEIGNTGLIGSAANDVTQQSFPMVVEGAGADIWGTSDTFEFVHAGADTASFGSISDRVDLHADQSFAKAGLMYRDGLAADAAMVIVDVKPDGGVEFMARPCGGCAVTYINGANLGLPAWLSLFRDGSTFHAYVSSANLSQRVDLGTVDVTMSTPTPGYAVTSHDMTKIAVGAFDDPPR